MRWTSTAQEYDRFPHLINHTQSKNQYSWKTLLTGARDPVSGNQPKQQLWAGQRKMKVAQKNLTPSRTENGQRALAWCRLGKSDQQENENVQSSNRWSWETVRGACSQGRTQSGPRNTSPNPEHRPDAPRKSPEEKGIWRDKNQWELGAEIEMGRENHHLGAVRAWAEIADRARKNKSQIMRTEELEMKHGVDKNQLQRKLDRAPVLAAGETEQHWDHRLEQDLQNRSQNYDRW
jgi:hypothetical protein